MGREIKTNKQIKEELLLTKKNVFIPMLQANKIFCNNYRGDILNINLKGCFPYSLELIKLVNNKMEIKYNHSKRKFSTDNIINVEFEYGVDSIEDSYTGLIESLDIEKDKELINMLKKKLENADKNKFYNKKVGLEALRENLYTEGFFIDTKIDIEDRYDKNGKLIKKGKKINNRSYYSVFARSGAKARTGNILFFKTKVVNMDTGEVIGNDKLFKFITKWKKLGMKIEKGMKTEEYSSLLAYENLVESTIIDTCNIQANEIFMTNDIISKFTVDKVNLVGINEKSGRLDSTIKENYEIKNILNDGMSLLDESEFIGRYKRKSFKLLRAAFFKSCGFNCKVQKFLKDNCPKNIEFEEWILTDLYGNKRYAKDIKIIISPCSVKIYKMREFIKTRNKNGTSDMECYNYWLQHAVVKEKGLFGIVKNDKESKMFNAKGERVSQLSYQILNSYPIDFDTTKKIYKEYEEKHIENLKNNIYYFNNFLAHNANSNNANECLAELQKINSNFYKTQVYRDVKKNSIYKYKHELKGGRVKLSNMDYLTILSNPVELLYNVVGKLPLIEGTNVIDEDKWKQIQPLKGNQCCTKMFEDGSLACYRSPHMSQSENGIMENIHNVELIDKYMNLNKSVIVANSIDVIITQGYGGLDYDSDALLVSDCKSLVTINKQCQDDYIIAVKDVEDEKSIYTICNKDFAIIDHKLAKSGKFIGRVVNNSQLVMSYYNNSTDKEFRAKLLKKINVGNCLSEICIDLAKKMYETLDIEKEINNLIVDLPKKTIETEDKDGNIKVKDVIIKPKFWTAVAENTEEEEQQAMNTPVDYMYDISNSITRAKKINDVVSITDLLVDLENINVEDYGKVKRKQIKKVEELLKDFTKDKDGIFADDSLDEDQRLVEIEDLYNEFIEKIKKLRLNKMSMRKIIIDMIDNEECDNSNILNLFYKINRKDFLELFSM